MQSELARHFSTVRRNKGIGLPQLARMIGYRNLSKGCRRIDNFEKFGQVHEQLLPKLAAALGIDSEAVAHLIDEDRQRYLREWEQWANIPIRPSIVLGHIGGIGWSEPLPEGISQESAEECASAVAKRRNRPICLVMSRRLSIQFDAEGNPELWNELKSNSIHAMIDELVEYERAETKAGPSHSI